MVPSGGDLMDIRNEWAHGRNIMVNTSLGTKHSMLYHYQQRLYAIPSKLIPLVITKCMSLIHLHVVHLAYLRIQCYLAHHGISIGHLVCPGKLALPHTVTGRVW